MVRKKPAFLLFPRALASAFDLRFTGLCCAGVLWLELVLRIYVYGFELTVSSLLLLLFSVSVGALVSLFCSIWGKKANTILLRVIFLIFTVYIGMQAVYYNIFKTFVILYSVGQGGLKVWQFWREAFTGIWNTIIVVVLIFVPFVLSCVFGKRVTPDTKLCLRSTVLRFVTGAAFYAAALLIIFNSGHGIMPLRYVYSESFIPQLTVERFGALTTMRLDIQDMIKRAESKTNATKKLDSYFGSLPERSTENEYTGMFEGKNLIWITAESFSSLAVDKKVTPTLYKLTNSGIICRNFYNPLWWVSTSDGEFVPLSGLLPVTGAWSFYQSSTGQMPYVMGNQLSSLGYRCFAYHNHDYTYYNRNISHPAYGYDFMGVGNGMENGITNQWPESDLEMINYTVPMYAQGDTPFHVYYLTVSGHLNYEFIDNAMAKKNKSLVDGLDLSEPARAYLSCNIELDRAMESLLSQLDEAGKLDDTLIVLTGDHYPYALEESAIEELHGGAFSDELELYRSSAIIWSPLIKEPVYVDKLCSTLDLLPTVSNLMGVEYDPRYLMGSDIFSDEPGLVIFRNRSYITDEGRYFADSDSYVPNEGSATGRQYARETLDTVIDKFSASERMIYYNYYGTLLSRKK